MTSLCEFNPQDCHLKCKNFSICSFVHLEKHLSEIETKIGNLYEGVNHLTEFCSSLGENFSFLKDDTINEFNLISKEIESLKANLNRNKEIQ